MDTKWKEDINLMVMRTLAPSGALVAVGLLPNNGFYEWYVVGSNNTRKVGRCPTREQAQSAAIQAAKEW